MKFLIYCDCVVNIYLCWVMFSIIYFGGYWYDMLNVCEKLRQVKMIGFVLYKLVTAQLRLGETDKTVKGFYRQAENSLSV